VSKRLLTAMLGLVTVGFVLAVGVLIGQARRHPTGATSVTTTTARTTAAVSSIAPRPSSMGVVAANLACADIGTSGQEHRWNTVVYLHGIDTGAIKEDPGQAASDDFERQKISDAHRYAVKAATEDTRWSELEPTLRESETAAISRWDRGGLSVHDAVTQAVGSYVPRILGICDAAVQQLKADALAANTSPSSLLSTGGASSNEVYRWQLMYTAGSSGPN